jgi:hypothetical protein
MLVLYRILLNKNVYNDESQLNLTTQVVIWLPMSVINHQCDH